jgi:transcriptional regulator with XRE-family HTH domain
MLKNLLTKNLNTLIIESKITQIELAKLAKIPYSTLNGLVLGNSANPRLITLSKIAKVFKLNVSQLIGELPLNFFDVIVPILDWKDLDFNIGTVNFNYYKNTDYISTSLCTKSKLFALQIKNRVSEKYSFNNIIIVEYTQNVNENNEILVSISRSKPIIKKVLKEGNEIYLSSVSHDLPPLKYDKQEMNIFGIIREVRTIN